MTSSISEFKIVGFPIAGSIKVIAPFALLTSIAEHMGFWMPFGINVFDYLSLQELIVRVIPTMVYLIAGYMLVLAVALLVKVTVMDLPKESILRKILYAVMFIASLVFAFLLVRTDSTFLRFVYLALALVFAFATGMQPIVYGSGKVDVSKKTVQLAIIGLLVAVPIAAVFPAYIRAKNIKEGATYWYVFDENRSVAVSDRTRWIGRAGEYYFFFEPKTSSEIITRSDEEPRLVLKLHDDRLIGD